MDETPAAGEKPHAVCVPFPSQGHITPMLNLAKILYCRGFQITFVNTEYNHRRLTRSRGADAVAGLPGFRFATIPDGLPPSDANATQDPASLCYSTMTTCLPHFKNLLADLNHRSSGVPPVTCVVADNMMSFSVDAAKELGVPCALFWTASACGFLGFRHYRLLIEKGLFPLQDEEQLTNGFLDTPVDWARGMSRHMRIGDFPSFVRTTDRDDILFNFLLRETERASASSAVILNTFDELERPAIDAMRAILPPVYSVGPLNLLTKQLVPEGPVDTLDSNLWKEEHDCLAWLDGRKPRSVVYVNYGSVTVMTNNELVEFAWGLANSGYDFLWVIRPDIVRGHTAVLPPEFLEASKDRGLLASWCLQEAVLRHEAVGVFLTHGGWNSTVESLCGGVPMLCWPFFAEQQTNCRYMSAEWGVGMEINHDVRRDAVEERIRDAMGGEKGREMRRRAVDWQETAVRATQSGGQSSANLEKLVRDVLLSGKGC